MHILARRGVAVPDDVRDRIMACADVVTLDAWIDKAVDATSIDEVLG